MDVFRDENDVANANSKLIDYQKSIGDENRRRCNPPNHSRSLFECELHAFRIWQERNAVLFAQQVLRAHQDVEAVRADEADDSHPYEAVEPATVVESLVHGENSGSQTTFE